MLIRKTNVAQKLSKRRLLERNFKNCIACKGRGIQYRTGLCKKCFYFGLAKDKLTHFQY